MSHTPTQPARGRVVPIRAPAKDASLLPLPPALADSAAGGPQPLDTLGRPLRDMRISVTDRCNFRCGYCMPRAAFGKDHVFLPQPDLLSFEEITRAARIALSLGVRKLRLTGGEPLLRKHLERLVEKLAALRTLDGKPPELTLTTNGSLLRRKAQSLKDAGLQRVTVSLDALHEPIFQRMSDTDFTAADVLDGIEAAQAAGLGPIKVNMVVQKGVNDGEIMPMARHFRHSGVELRFIEFMDVGQTNQWRMDQVLPSAELRALIHAEFPLRPAHAGEASAQGATAERWAYADGSGHVGFISSVTQAFCGDCSRLRLSTDGRLYTCLFASQGHDLRSLLRDAAVSDDEITARMRALWTARQDRYSQLRSPGGMASETSPMRQDESSRTPLPRVEMSYIGG